MIPITTNEHLVYFMQCGYMRLSRHDLKFLQNLMTITNQNKSLTTNQIELFDKLVKKYSRQLLKHGWDYDKISTLPWKTGIIPSDPQFTEAFIAIEQDTIIFRSPFSKKFLNKFSKIEINTFKWNKDEKVYKSPYSAHALKFIFDIANEFYPKVNFCKNTSKKVSQFIKYKNDYWNPTLIKIDDYYLIAATNQYIDNALKDVVLTSDPRCLSLLAWHGVTIDKSIINGDPLLEFCSRYIAEGDVKDINLLVSYLKCIGCTDVIFHGPGSNKIKEDFKKTIDINIISLYDSVKCNESTVLIATRMYSVLSTIQATGKYMKIIQLKNSMPIERF